MRGHSKDVLIFILIAVSLMWLADYFFMGGQEAHRTLKGEPSPYVQSEPAPVHIPDHAPPGPPPPDVAPPEGLPDEVVIVPAPDYDLFDFFNEQEWDVEEEEGLPEPAVPQPPSASVEPLPPASEPAPLPPVPAIPRGMKPRIAIIIDDVGMNKKWSDEALNLPGPVTMAILPYAAQASDFAKRSKEKGHDILIHTPMEAMNAPVSLGGMGLTTDMGEAEIIAMMELIALKMDGYIGINNHMGSKFTSDRAAMERLMPYLKKRGLIFIDSKTIGHSVAANVAAEHGVPTASRDVFLDHEETPEFVMRALAQAERVAMKKGHAIAIGHPKAVTINGLKAWIPTLADKGIELVPISTLVTLAKPKPVETTVSVPPTPAPETVPDLPLTEPPLLYSPSPEIHY